MTCKSPVFPRKMNEITNIEKPEKPAAEKRQFLASIERLFLDGFTPFQIADELGEDRRIVSRNLRELKKRWPAPPRGNARRSPGPNAPPSSARPCKAGSVRNSPSSPRPSRPIRKTKKSRRPLAARKGRATRPSLWPPSPP